MEVVNTPSERRENPAHRENRLIYRPNNIISASNFIGFRVETNDESGITVNPGSPIPFI